MSDYDDGGIQSIETARALRAMEEWEREEDWSHPGVGSQSEAYYRAIAHHHALFVALEEGAR